MGLVCPAAPLGPPLVGLWEREVRQKDRSVSGSPSRSLTLMDFGGMGSVAPVEDTWEEWALWGHRVSVEPGTNHVVKVVAADVVGILLLDALDMVN